MPTFPSADRHTQIFYHAWLPETAPRAVLVFFHGMLEHSGRYAGFAATLNARGIAIYAPDHLGHGRSLAPEGLRGHFADSGGNAIVVRDCLHMLSLAHAAHPGTPLFLCGHSMGSFLARQLTHQFTLPPLAGLILLGSSQQPRAALRSMRLLVGALRRHYGPRYKSEGLRRLLLASTGHASPRRAEAAAAAMQNDPLNGDNFTLAAYCDLFDGMLTNTDPRRLTRVDTHLPVLILSGACDPVGGNGRGVQALLRHYLDLGTRDAHAILYDGCGHELVTARHADAVTADLLEWIGQHLSD